MKVVCSECELAEAKLMCCTCDAVLCQSCDLEKIHAADKVSGEHQRVALCAPSSPKCDICQFLRETVGYFFCTKDRALLCQDCDASIHAMNDSAAAHQRFLMPGVRVGIKSVERSPSTADMVKSNHVTNKTRTSRPQTVPRRIRPQSIPSQLGKPSVSDPYSAETGSHLPPYGDQFSGQSNFSPSLEAGGQKPANLEHEDSCMVPVSTSQPAASKSHPNWLDDPHDGSSFVPEIFFLLIFEDTQSQSPGRFKAKRRRQSYI